MFSDFSDESDRNNAHSDDQSFKGPEDQHVHRLRKRRQHREVHSDDDIELEFLKPVRRAPRSRLIRNLVQRRELEEQRQREAMAQNLADIARLMQAAGLGRPPLPKFDGTTSVEQFLTLYDSACADMALEGADAIKILREAMEGEAQFFFTQKITSDRAAGNNPNVEEWKQRLRERFSKSYVVQNAELRSRKMKPDESASVYVDTIVRMAKSMNPPLNDEQILITLHDNCLPKYKNIMLSSDPENAERFKSKLSRVMTSWSEEPGVPEQLAAALAKLTEASAQLSAKAVTGSSSASGSGAAPANTTYNAALVAQSQSGGDFNQRQHQDTNYQFSGNRGQANWRGSFRGRGRGRGGRGNWFGQNWNYNNQSYGYRPPFQSRVYWSPNPRWQQPQWQPQQWGQWNSPPQGQQQRFPAITGPRGQVQGHVYVVEHPATPQAQQSSSDSQQPEDQQFFPENY